MHWLVGPYADSGMNRIVSGRELMADLIHRPHRARLRDPTLRLHPLARCGWASAPGGGRNSPVDESRAAGERRTDPGRNVAHHGHRWVDRHRFVTKRRADLSSVTAVASSDPAFGARLLDVDSSQWLEELTAQGAAREAGLA